MRKVWSDASPTDYRHITIRTLESGRFVGRRVSLPTNRRGSRTAPRAEGTRLIMNRERQRRRIRPRLVSLESLESRRLLSASLVRDPGNPTEWIVSLTEARPGTSDTLRLRANSRGELEFQI